MGNFTIVPNEVFEDARLSLKAMGLLTYILSKPDDWNISAAQLSRFLGEGTFTIRSAMRELVDCGYAKLDHPKAENGFFTGPVWTVSDTPIFRPAKKQRSAKRKK